jgi:hypothetical protein
MVRADCAETSHPGRVGHGPSPRVYELVCAIDAPGIVDTSRQAMQKNVPIGIAAVYDRIENNYLSWLWAVRSFRQQ